jgi:hypothetical protein
LLAIGAAGRNIGHDSFQPCTPDLPVSIDQQRRPDLNDKPGARAGA